jgi:simple sugar transport system ATP-binding protein
LVGENGSGKSTLIKIISGVVKPEKGSEIFITGQRESLVHYTSTTSISRGIHVIYQDLSLFPNLTVAENISFNLVTERGRRVVSWQTIRSGAKKVIDEVGVKLDLERPVGILSIASQQLVAICRALVGKTMLLIMDEPTSSLSHNEVSALFAVVRRLQLRGITTLFVSHKLNEILEIAERITVLRDGRKTGTFRPEEIDLRSLTFHMTGKEVSRSKLKKREGPQEVLMEAIHLSRRGSFRDVSLKLHRGEILGIIGLLGSGRTELARAIFGIDAIEEGEVRIEGRPVKIRSNSEAIRHGIGLVPENRLLEGLIMPHSLLNNMTITVLNRLLSPLHLIDRRRRAQTASRWMTDLNIRATSAHVPVMTLSGGNQQRVVLAKWIATGPKILILDGPTIGIDVAAKSSIHQIILQLAESGIGVILISDEATEALYNCHRLLVMSKGRIIAEHNTEDISEDELLRAYGLE